MKYKEENVDNRCLYSSGNNFLKDLDEFVHVNANLLRDSTESVAFYVARHAVLAIDVGIKVDRIYISNDETGFCELEPLPPALASKEIVNLVAMYMAGVHGCFPATCCRSVLQIIGQALEGKPLDVQVVQDAVEKRSDLISRCEGQIEAVADALLNAPTHSLSG